MDSEYWPGATAAPSIHFVCQLRWPTGLIL